MCEMIIKCQCLLTFWNKHPILTHWGRDKTDGIWQTTVSNAISWMKIFEFWLKFHWNLFLKVQLTIFWLGLDNGLEPNRWQAIIWTNDDQVQRSIYASLRLNELKIYAISGLIRQILVNQVKTWYKYYPQWQPTSLCCQTNCKTIAYT